MVPNGSCRLAGHSADRRRDRRRGDFMQFEYREEQVLQMLMSGLSNQQISSILGIEKDGVKQHMRRILAKLKGAVPVARPNLTLIGTPTAM
jgi:DNA-binding NarL/FixJ family response regulator